MNPDRLDHLIQGLLDGTLDESSCGELNDILGGSREARDRYRRAMALHSVLTRGLAMGPLADEPVAFPARNRWKKPLALVAAVALVVTLTALIVARPASPRARLASGNGVSWGTVSLTADQNLPVAVPLEILRGVAELSFPSGARVTLEGPCRFQLDHPEAITVLHGRASVHAPPGAQGFRVDTPGGRFVDLGTRFGLAVGSDGASPVILTEVYEGEVEVQAVPDKTRLYGGDARALVQGAGGPRLFASLDSEPVKVPRLVAAASPEAGFNLALGKPVSSPGYCIRPHGSVFPPENLTDGRLDDTGVPGDWSFWLAPNGEHGEFTVDLEAPISISRIALQNTANRGIDDRGLADFTVLASTDNVNFTEVARDHLPRIDVKAGRPYPFHDVVFAPVTARYVKVVATSHYRHLQRPADHANQGGGLNEIRIFSE